MDIQTPPFLELHNAVVQRAGAPILTVDSFRLEEREHLALLGPNGSGKSTLMNVIMGHPKYEMTGGSLILEGEDIGELRAFERARRGLFLAFQTPEEIPGITVENMIRTARQVMTGEKVKLLPFRKELNAMMAELKIDPSYAQRYLNVGFSGGEKKRSEVLQLLMFAPKVALLDETDSGLDVDAVQIVSEGVAKFHNKNNACIIITHNAKILDRLKVDYVHVLAQGKIAREGGAELIEEINEEGFAKILGAQDKVG